MCLKRFGKTAFLGLIVFMFFFSDLAGVIGKAYAKNELDGLTDIPYALIVYKYAPEKITDDMLKNSLREIIGKEQWQYEATRRAKEQNREPIAGDAFLLFSEEQLAGRAMDFAADDLIEEYKAFLSKEAAAIPDIIRLEFYSNINFYKYENGVINSNTRSGQGADVFLRFSVVNEQKKASIPALGSREILIGTYHLRSEVSSPGFAKLPSIHNRVQLAIDLVPIIPPVAMQRGDAEKLFIIPDERQECGVRPSFYPKPDPQVLAVYESCIENFRSKVQIYNRGFRTSYVVTPEGFVEGTNILALHVNRVEIYNPYGDLMRTFMPSDLAAPTDAFAEQKTAERRLAKAETEATRKQAKENSSMSTKIRAADIDGLELSMSYSEAETAVRKKLKIGRVRESKSTQMTTPYFSDITQFENIDGSERIMLFRAKPNSEKLVGIGRWLDLPQEATLKDVKDQLIDKYGEPTTTIYDGLTWHGKKSARTCDLSIGWTHAPVIKEGEELAKYEQYGSFLVSPMYASDPGKLKNDVLAEIRKECSPQLIALVQMSKLLVVLLDVPGYAAENMDENIPTNVKLDL